MTLEANFFLLIISFVLLWLGTELTVKGAVMIAKNKGWSQSFIGLTLVSFALNFTEIVITFSGAFRQAGGEEVSQLIIGSIVGSNMIRITLVLGLAGLFQIIKVDKKEIIGNGLALIISTLLLFLFAINGKITQINGLILLASYFLYILLLSKNGLKSTQAKAIASFKRKSKKLQTKLNLKAFIKLIVGLIIIGFASELTVNSSLNAADILNVNQLGVGVFIIGIGVSLPEMFVSVAALTKGSSRLSVGTMLGGNIIVTLAALGGSALITDWPIAREVATFDIAYLLLCAVVVVLFLLSKRQFDRKESILVLLLYVIYALLKSFGF